MAILTQKQFLIIMVIVIVAYLFGFGLKKFTKPASNAEGICGQYSTKDGYTACNSIKIGESNKCKFKIDNKINVTTQKMEFQYTCLEK